MVIIEKSSSKKFLYQCEPNDDLNSISNRFGVSIEQIKQDNPYFSNIYTGCVLLIGADNKKRIIVKPMQKLADIAREYDTTIAELIALNNLKSEQIFVGMQLVVRVEEV